MQYKISMTTCLLFLILVSSSLLGGCSKPHGQEVDLPVTSQKPAYARKLADGKQALIKLSPQQWPDLTPLLNQPNEFELEKALKRSLAWFATPSSQSHFPLAQITHQQAQASVLAMLNMIRPLKLKQITQQFDLYQSVGWDGQGAVLFTGYYSPIFQASLTQTPIFKYPLYRKPSDLISDPQSGKVLGRQQSDGSMVSYYTRQEINENHVLAGLELVWLSDPFDVYLVQIQGSAHLQLTDGSVMYVGYAATNGHAYQSVAKQLIAEGLLDKNSLNLPAIEAFFKEHPEELSPRLAANARYVFFTRYEPQTWPSGSMGFKVTPGITLATDKSIFPRGGPTLIRVSMTSDDGTLQKQLRMMVDQDTGGALRAPGRCDIYYGVGSVAQMRAGYQMAQGQLYYFFLKPEYVSQWIARLSLPEQ